MNSTEVRVVKYMRYMLHILSKNNILYNFAKNMNIIGYLFSTSLKGI